MVLAARFAVSVRQARRYVDQAAARGRVPVPEAERGVHRQAARGGWPGGCGRTRARPRPRSPPLVARHWTEFLARGRRDHPRR